MALPTQMAGPELTQPGLLGVNSGEHSEQQAANMRGADGGVVSSGGGFDPNDPNNEGKLPKHLRNKMKRIENQTAAGGMRGVSGNVSQSESLALGRRFVGPNYSVSQTGNGTTIFRSSDGLRQFRAASPKNGINRMTGQPYSRTGWQVNFESRAVARSRFTNNVHLDVKF